MVTVSGNPRSVKERHLDMDVRRSATKHGIKPEDSVTAATSGCVFKAPLDEEHPQGGNTPGVRRLNETARARRSPLGRRHRNDHPLAEGAQTISKPARLVTNSFKETR